ncbi:omega-6 fatty acid desaturase (delta-12 desaturase) [Limimonas halophila]|uniref:Omega-6 fatty acid desaturase (Delta-12 desaturase) n=1 Tax=Limimonas halophila TaxID=1082479 RepID=A0A1G7SSD5_9PROT|nr:fatty acid desaturase [Limimonas halophila]SDG25190.1 omega-6 fatty acid desaturase (delta-12 desaturase) [Limimonas halophila]
MTAETADADPITDTAALRRAVAEHQGPILRHSLSQIASSFGGFAGVCAAMYLLLDVSVWLALPLAPLAAGFLVRIFIIQHDCGHGAFFRSRRANDHLGRICSLLTLTPYSSWRRQHAGHHGIWNDLDRRDTGADIYSDCLTVAEYRALTPRQRFWHRAVRHPLVAHILIPPLVFLVLYRVPFDTPKARKRERRGVYLTDLALLVGYGGLGALVGFGPMAAVQGPVMAVGAIVGVWLFSVQHRFEETWWARNDDWSFGKAALHGSSFLRLPRVLQWFTGNIGYHHVHHLNPRVPNYRLEAAHNRIAADCTVPELTLRDGLLAPRHVLWDEENDRMVPFRAASTA